jgi:CheY-like chemotaxis protein
VNIIKAAETSGGEVMKAVAQEAHMVDKPIRVLAIDDEVFNLEILTKHLNKAGFEAIEAKSGEEAWEYLRSHPDGVDIILMDKMMPGINGIDLTKKIKADPALRHIVVIIQTASVGTQAVVEGIESGAYYYLTKPYAAEVLISIVEAAAREYKQQAQMLDKAQDKKIIQSITQKIEFELRTIKEARSLAVHIGEFCSGGGKIALGLSGLLVNAVEHGNLGIGYHKKLELLNKGKWEEEISQRLESPEYKDRTVKVSMFREGRNLVIDIKDEGRGFDPSPYFDYDPSRITDPNGRGIAMANIMDDSKIEYLGSGNEVRCTIKI